MPIAKENRGRYPANWKEISTRIRFVRAEGRCECDGRCGIDHSGRCEAKHGHPNPMTGSTVVLTVAHFDHTPENCEDDNLGAYCQRCHLRFDAEHHATNRKARKAAEKQRVLDKAGQIAFEMECSR